MLKILFLIFISFKLSLLVPLGSNIKFVCKNYESISWYAPPDETLLDDGFIKDDHFIEGSNNKFQLKNKNSEIYIYNISVLDVGEYVCSDNTENNNDIFELHAEIENKNIKGYIGSDISFKCPHVNKNSIYPQWKLNISKHRTIIDKDLTLNIKNVQLNDTGIFKCYISKYLTLNINFTVFKPDIILEKILNQIENEKPIDNLNKIYKELTKDFVESYIEKYVYEILVKKNSTTFIPYLNKELTKIYGKKTNKTIGNIIEKYCKEVFRSIVDKDFIKPLQTKEFEKKIMKYIILELLTKTEFKEDIKKRFNSIANFYPKIKGRSFFRNLTEKVLNIEIREEDKNNNGKIYLNFIELLRTVYGDDKYNGEIRYHTRVRYIKNNVKFFDHMKLFLRNLIITPSTDKVFNITINEELLKNNDIKIVENRLIKVLKELVQEKYPNKKELDKHYRNLINEDISINRLEIILKNNIKRLLSKFYPQNDTDELFKEIINDMSPMDEFETKIHKYFRKILFNTKELVINESLNNLYKREPREKIIPHIKKILLNIFKEKVRNKDNYIIKYKLWDNFKVLIENVYGKNDTDLLLKEIGDYFKTNTIIKIIKNKIIYDYYINPVFDNFEYINSLANLVVESSNNDENEDVPKRNKREIKDDNCDCTDSFFKNISVVDIKNIIYKIVNNYIDSSENERFKYILQNKIEKIASENPSLTINYRTQRASTTVQIEGKCGKNSIVDLRKNYRNIGYILTGYNLLRGFPMTNGMDPGFKDQIFKSEYSKVISSGDCEYSIPKGLIVQKITACKTEFAQNEIKTEKDILDFNSILVSVKKTLNADVVGVNFTASGGFQNLVNEITRENKVILMGTAHCNFYKSFLANIRPEFTEEFYDGLLYLQEDYDDSDRFYEFFESFGTHFPIEIVMGARYIKQYELNEKEYTHIKMKKWNVQIGASVKADFGGASGDIGVSNENDKNVTEYFKTVKTKVITVGAPFPSEGSEKEWAKAVSMTDPLPVNTILKPMEDLFFKFQDNINYIRLNYTQLYRYIKTHRLNYCKYLSSIGLVRTCDTRNIEVSSFVDNIIFNPTANSNDNGLNDIISLKGVSSIAPNMIYHTYSTKDGCIEICKLNPDCYAVSWGIEYGLIGTCFLFSPKNYIISDYYKSCFHALSIIKFLQGKYEGDCNHWGWGSSIFGVAPDYFCDDCDKTCPAWDYTDWSDKAHEFYDEKLGPSKCYNGDYYKCFTPTNKLYFNYDWETNSFDKGFDNRTIGVLTMYKEDKGELIFLAKDHREITGNIIMPKMGISKFVGESETFTSFTVVECAIGCFLKDKCIGFNYFEGDTCEMFDGKTISGDLTKDAVQAYLIDKRAGNYKIEDFKYKSPFLGIPYRLRDNILRIEDMEIEDGYFEGVVDGFVGYVKCFKDPDCYAVNYKNGEYKTLKNKGIINLKKSFRGINTEIIVSRISGTIIPNYQIYGARIEQLNYYNKEDCYKVCNENENCIGINVLDTKISNVTTLVCAYYSKLIKLNYVKPEIETPRYVIFMRPFDVLFTETKK